jgi:hypothetical protein
MRRHRHVIERGAASPLERDEQGQRSCLADRFGARRGRRPGHGRQRWQVGHFGTDGSRSIVTAKSIRVSASLPVFASATAGVVAVAAPGTTPTFPHFTVSGTDGIPMMKSIESLDAAFQMSMMTQESSAPYTAGP